MENVIYFLFNALSQLISFLLSIKVIGQFSILHIFGGILIIKLIIKLITFGSSRFSERSNVKNE